MAVHNKGSYNMHIVSYNMHGFNQGSYLLSELCSSNDVKIIFVQEHWMSPANLHKILNFHKEYTGFGISAMENVVSKSVLKGRPFGGVSVLVHNDLLQNVNCIHASEKFVIITYFNTIFINVYFPCSSTCCSDQILSGILAEVSNIVSLYDGFNIIFGGDLNIDLSANLNRAKPIQEFIDNFNLVITADVCLPNCKYTYCHEQLQNFSTIDYLIVSKCLVEQSMHYCVLDNLINFSDHLPISLQCVLPVTCLSNARISLETTKKVLSVKSSLRWDKADLRQYYSKTYIELQPILYDLNVLYNTYVDTHCNKYFSITNEPILHRNQLLESRSIVIAKIESVYSNIVNTLQSTAELSIPLMPKNTLKHWWNDELNSLKKQAIDSNYSWINAGKPATGLIAVARKNDKYAYKLAIRKFKKAEKEGITEALGECLSDKNSNSFWKVWRSKMGVQRAIPKCVDNLCAESEIADSFAKYFSKACDSNSVSRSNALCHEYVNKRQLYKDNDNLLDCLLSVDIVDSYIAKLKCGKSAGVDRLTAEHLLNAHPIIVQVLTKLLNLMILFEYVPDAFGLSIVVPIPKSNTGKNKVCSDEFRGISINVIISKLFEHCLLYLFSLYLDSSILQFGFKAKSSCSKALYSVRKTVEFFIERQSTVNLCALDLTKAFDKLNRHALFIKLFNKCCPILLINILECWFSKTFACVKWGESISNSFQLLCGTRQGGIISPVLFAVCINDVIVKLQNSSLGCHINNLCLSVFMYADDLLLLSVSICELQKMLNICKTELDWLDMSLNIKKCSCIRVGKRYNVLHKELSIDGNCIKWSNEVKYLGIVIMAASVFRINFHDIKIKFFQSLNGVLGKLGSAPQVNITLSLVSSFCNPILLYGIEALHLKKADIASLTFPYNSVFTKLFSTFDKSVITLCQFYTYQLPLCYIIDARTLNFYSDLCSGTCYTSNCLFKWFGEAERKTIEARYNILPSDSAYISSMKIKKTFEHLAEGINMI